MQTGVRGITLLMFIALLGMAGLAALFYTPEVPERSYSQLVEEVAAGRVLSVIIGGSAATVVTGDGERYRVNLPTQVDALLALLQETGVTLEYSHEVDAVGEPGLLFWLMPLMMIGSALWMMNQVGEKQDSFAFGETRARPVGQTERRTTLRDVAGLPEAKEEVGEIVDFLRSPERYVEMGARIPRGVLLWGPPGTGKTLLARAVAGEAGVPFFSVAGSEFVEMYAGVGASRIRSLFTRAREEAPCILFIDELDAVGKRRGSHAGSGTDERDQTLNQILVELDGFDTTEGIIVMAATNRPDTLDPALLRPGRFDRQIAVELPDSRGRAEILQVHGRGKPLAPSVDLARVAALTPGFSGADLANLLNESALLAARCRRSRIEQDDILAAYDRIRAGGPPVRRVLTESERLRIALHEAGHALVSSRLPHADPVEKLSLVSHGRALGSVLYRVRTEKGTVSRSELMDRMSALLGGRAAEAVLLGEVGTGAADDLEQVTGMARRMATELGMSPEIGPVAVGVQQSTLTGDEYRRSTSEWSALAVDHAVRALVAEAYRGACGLVEAEAEVVRRIATSLLEQESLSAAELGDLLGPDWVGER